MRKTVISFALCALLPALCASAQAQQPKKVPRIGFLMAVSPSTIPARVEAFRQGLRELGYVEGKNIVIEWRSAEGKLDRLPALAAELVHLKVDVIVTGAPTSTRSAKQATVTIPIVMATSTDPVGSGLIASFARPGGNVTGLTSVTGEIGGKHLELLKEIVPRLNRVAILRSEGRATDLFIKEAEVPARALKIQLISFVFGGPDDFEGAFRAMTKEGVFSGG